MKKTLKKVYMWYKIKELYSKGFNKSQISEELKVDRGTVRRYLLMSEHEFHGWIEKPRHLPKKLTGYYNFIKHLLEKYPYLSAAQVEDRLKEHFEDLPPVHSKTIYNFVQGIRKECNIPKRKQKKLRQYEKLPELPYGQQSQVDFGQYHMQTENGRRMKVYFFVMVLCRSRQKFVYFQAVPFTTATAVYAHELAFKYFGGATKEILYDQDRVFVQEENLGDVLLTDGFRKFCDSSPFKAVFCRKSDPETKGKVENVVKYVKYNFLKGRIYLSADLLQQECIKWLQRTGNAKRHQTTWKIPCKEWELEHPHLLPVHDPVNVSKETRKPYKVRKDNTIAYKGNFYTLPIGTYSDHETTVFLEENHGKLQLYSAANEIIASHAICYLKGKLISNTDHRRDKSNKIQQSRQEAFVLLGEGQKASQYLELLEKDKPRYYHDNLKVILKGLKNMPVSIIKQSLEFCLENRVYNGYRFVEVTNYYHNQQSARNSILKEPLPRSIHNKTIVYNIEPKTSNIEQYESIIK